MKGHQIYRNYVGKAWEIIGYTFDGSAYCPDHMPNYTDRSGNEPAPIFAIDEVDGMECDECQAVIG